MWSEEQRQAHDRAGLRYPSDLTDAEWALVEPFVPPARRGGRRRTVDVREVPNGIFHVLATGCQPVARPAHGPAAAEHGGCTTTSPFGPGTARCGACTTPCSSRRASRWAKRQARPPRSSAARA